MNNKITSSALAALIIAGSTSFTAFATMASGTVVIGNKAFDLAYANDPANAQEITNAIVAGGAVYVKDFEGNWIDNTTGLTVNASVIPAVTYKNATGETNFDAADKDAVDKSLVVESVSAITNTNNFTVTLKNEAIAETLAGKKLTLTPATGTAVEATFKSVTGKVATFEFAAASTEAEYVVSGEDFVVTAGTKVVYDKTAPTVKVADSKFTDYKTMTIALSEKVTGIPVVKVNGTVEAAANVALAADGMSITVTRNAGFVAGTYNVVLNGLTDVATNAMSVDTTVSVVKAVSYSATFTNITNAVTTNAVNEVHFTAVDQYGKAIGIVPDSSYKLTVTVNGMPLTSTINGAGEADLTQDGNMAMLTITKTLVESDNVVVKLDKYDKAATASDAKLLGTITSNYTVVKGATVAAKSILGVTASVNAISAGDPQVTLTADVRDQYNNPIDGDLRWVVEQGGELLNIADAGLNSILLTNDTTANNTMTFTAIKPGTIVISAYNKLNGVKSTYTVTVAPTKLADITAPTFANSASKLFSQEDVKSDALVFTAGAKLSAADLNYVITSKPDKSEDPVIKFVDGTGDDAGKIFATVNTPTTGTYKFKVFKGVSATDANAIVSAEDTITTIANLTVNSISVDAFKTNELTATTEVKKNITFKNVHGEVISVAAKDLKIANTANMSVTIYDKDGNALLASANTSVASLGFIVAAAGNDTVVIATGAKTLSVNTTAVATGTLSSISTDANVSVINGDTNTLSGSQVVVGGLSYQLHEITMKDQYNNALTNLAPNDLTVTGADGNYKVLFFDADKANITLATTGVKYVGIAATGLTDSSLPTPKTITIAKTGTTTVKADVSVSVTATRKLTTLSATPAIGNVVVNGDAVYVISGKDQYNVDIDATPGNGSNSAGVFANSEVGGKYTVVVADATAADAGHKVNVTVTGNVAGNYTIPVYYDTAAYGTKDATEKSINVSLNVQEVGDAINTIAIQPTVTVNGTATDLTKYKAHATGANTFAFSTKAYDANNNLVTVPVGTINYTVVGSALKDALGNAVTAATAGLGINSLGNLTFTTGTVATGTITVRAYSVNGKISDMTINVDSSAAVAQAGTYYLADDATGMSAGKADTALTTVELKEVEGKDASGNTLRDTTAYGVRSVNIVAVDQYGQLVNVTENAAGITIGQDSSVYFTTTPSADGITITAKAVGSSTLRIFSNGTQIDTVTITVDKDAVDAAKATAAVVTAEASKLTADKTAAQTLVTALPDGAVKAALQVRLGAIVTTG